jgi:hypothetical protein
MKNKLSFSLIIGVALLVVVIFIHTNNETRIENFQMHLAQPSKCFDCEKDFKQSYKWMAQPSKCFDCEKELVGRTGNAKLGYLAQPTKCFDCEKEMHNSH